MAAIAREMSDPEDARIRALLRDWVDGRHQCRGVSAAAIEGDRIRYLSHGVMGLQDKREVGRDTVFGIASLTKVFTGLLLTDAVLRKEVALTDPVRLYLPNTRVPNYRGREITLLDLAMQTTGLPQEIPNYAEAAANIGADPNAPLFGFLESLELTRPIGEAWSYSNLNYALIGLALSHRAGLSYESLIVKRIANPLQLKDTRVTATPDMATRRASPHLDYDAPAPEWNKPWSLGAGALQSTGQDLAHFLDHAVNGISSPLQDAFAAMLQTTHPAPFLEGDQAIGCAIDRSHGDARVFFGGRAPGFTSSMMFDPKARRGAVVLGNSALMVESLGREILRPGSTAPSPASQTTIAPAPELDRLVGRYALDEPHRDANFAAGEIVDISRTATGLAVFMPRYPKTDLKRLGDGVFGIDGFSVRYEFAPGPAPAASMSLTINGKAVIATRTK
ncbi:MAG TPA: serine hydrolase domain-containing protein [Steroidobacteraceae bacterium]|nr:serine hydrolase domain-containing protein [Steroidobacteraceae bacterium]